MRSTVLTTIARGCVAASLSIAIGAGALAAAPASVPEVSAASSLQAAADQQQRRFAPHFGGTVFERPGESYREAFLRVRRTYGGKLGIVRLFYSGLPASWSKIRSNVGSTRLAISFRAAPAEVLAGRHDAALRNWFADAPRGHVTRWSYMHEPENDSLNNGQYRRAWRHVNELAQKAGNRKLRSTLILMCWTLEKNSGRDWRDYYPGARVIDVLAFDCYNAGHRNDTYRSVRELLSGAARLSKRIDKPWAIAELGSVVVGGDDGRGRAAWLKRVARFAHDRGARFVTYFDSDVGVDYRLHDAASRSAWRTIVRRSN